MADQNDTPVDLSVRPLDILTIVPLAGAYCYSLGWIFCQFLFAQLGLQAENVGINAEYLFVRSVLLLTVVAILVGILVMLSGVPQVLRLGERGQLRFFHAGFAIFHVLFVLLLYLSLYAVIRAFFRNLGPLPAAIVALLGAGAATGILATLGFLAFGYRISGRGTLLSPMSLKHSVMATCLGAVLLYPMVMAAGIEVGKSVVNGKPLRTFPLSIRPVNIYGGEARRELPASIARSCYFLRLGESGGAVVLYEPETKTIIHVPLSKVMLVQPRDLEKGHC